MLYPGSSAQAALGFCCMQMTYDNYDTVESMEELPVEDLESRSGEVSSLSEHGEDKDLGLWPQSEPSEKIWKESLWRLSDRCRKKCLLLWWMLVLGPQEMQWNQRLLAP